tara:strand:- start:128 stop:883 length:756 start_codon:yes stop_codon:yes gene_type:complete
MGKITKIMLGLNIVAGIVGIVFGMGVKGDLKEAETAKNDAFTKVEDAGKGASGLKSANEQLKSELAVVKGSWASISNNWEAAKADLITAQENLKIATTEKEEAQIGAGKLQVAQEQVRDLTEEKNALQGVLEDYRALGSLEEIRQMKKKAEKPKPANPDGNGPNKPKPPKPQPTAGAEIGRIVSFDKKFGFYVINRGTDHGVKNGDEFKVVRAANLVGKIKIADAQPSVSIAEPIKELTRQQLQPGDILRK